MDERRALFGREPAISGEVTWIVDSLVEHYEREGNAEKAAQWRAKLAVVQDAVASDPPAVETQDE